MKLLEGVLALCAACAVPQAGRAHNLETFPEGADPVVLNTQDAQRNVRGKAGSVVSQFVFQGDGVLRPTGSGAVCTVNVTPVATNGTLTIDCTQFAFTAGETKTLHLAGGVYCGTAGVLAVRGAEVVKAGYREAAACPALSIPQRRSGRRHAGDRRGRGALRPSAEGPAALEHRAGRLGLRAGGQRPGGGNGRGRA